MKWIKCTCSTKKMGLQMLLMLSTIAVQIKVKGKF